MGDRAALVSLFVNNGVVDPKEMRRIYDEGGDVGDVKPAVVEASYPREREVLDLVNKSNADFVSRLKDENRVTIPDWKDKDKVATHKLAYAQDGDRWIVYPLVQNIDGKLYDFEDPQYGLNKGWQALDSALYSGDYVELPSKADARWFTESYKNHYPGFNKYDGKTEKSQYIAGFDMDDYVNQGAHDDFTGYDINKFYSGGLFAKKYKGTFNEAFRNARADGRKYFRWNGNRYNTNITPNPIVEAVKKWDTGDNLAKKDFKMQVIRNPNAILEYYNNAYPSGKYSTTNKLINQYDFDTMYRLGTKGIEGLVMPRSANYKIGDEIWNELNNSNLTYNQKLAILANSFHETAGWTALTQFGGGPAKGVFMMEKAQRNAYNDWLKSNGLKDSYGNQARYVVDLFASKDKSLSTSWDNKKDKQDIIRGFANESDAQKMGPGYRSAYNHMGYTTNNAYNDWYSDSLDANTKAFEGLFERAGVPALENRQRIAFILGDRYK